ncbi:hypothetical protein CLV51_101987 [Chitinophaga niastensis]|uniref:Uncharacterized protein n=1 Tax=Chitinophaga niastensis TaxID=536980 RepID=A0A2P8HTX3_CHINA|nr:hypothetical protein [Chitinophaga niastensis]PSL49652.1 hypothetical protein CLV51_101987 [Chitinophaga niastensis]
MKDVTHTALFECIMSGEINGSLYDLHNDYECIKIQHDATQKTLELRFVNDDYKIIVEFYQVTITNFTINPSRTAESSTLDLFYRGRFERNNNLHEVTDLGEYYFYLAWLEHDAIELFAKQVTLKMSRLNS